MNDLPPDLLSRLITRFERAGDMLVAEFHRIPRPRGHGDKADVDQEIELMLREQLLALLRCRFMGEETGVRSHLDARFCWVVDPHDGTSAFLGHRGSAILVAPLPDTW
jgi:fructose-1,6-bisphosphatase/inositol monophosphatase family enzyme